jgi:serine protease Do
LAGWFAVTLLLTALTGGAASAQDNRRIPVNRDQITLSFAPLVERTAPAVVSIFARTLVRHPGAPAVLQSSALWRLFSDALLFGYGARERVENSLGSGVIVRPDGIVVTNHHVIANAQGVLVGLADDRIVPAEILLSDARTDVAVLRVSAYGEELPYLEFGDSDRLRVGDLVLAIGNPFGIGQTVTSGIVSALARTGVGITDLRYFIQTDAAINPGNSGGAQVAMDAKLIGINTAIFSGEIGAQGIGFAVPSNMVRRLVEDAVGGRPLKRAWMGISGVPLDPRFAAFMGVPGAAGIVVTNVHPDGPAAAAGMVAGDIVLAIGDFATGDFQALRYRVATRFVGETVEVAILSAGMPATLEITLVAPPESPPRDDRWLPPIHVLSGAKVASLSPALAEEMGLDSAITGIAVIEVGAGSSAQRFGLHAGDVIRAFMDTELATVADLLEVKVPRLRPWGFLIDRGGDPVLVGPS